jgi:hypothetical protein
VELFLLFLASTGPRSRANNIRGVIVHVKFEHSIDPYFDIPMPKLMKGWWKKWFYLRNDDFVLLPVFTDNRPIPLPT